MKFSCDKYVLQQAAASAARAAAAKSPIPTLEGLLIEAGASVRISAARADPTNVVYSRWRSKYSPDARR